MRRATAAGVLLALMGTAVCGTHAAFADSAVPYSDPRATGALALCGEDGHQVTSGRVDAQPFVWRAVSSIAAPAPYDRSGRTATLFAYQPRPQVDPAQWSGELVTASARYTDASHPMAAATVLDEPLSDFLDAYPTRLDGLVQLRLYLGAPGQPAYTLQYAAANIRVTGGTWQLVGRAPNVSCTSGSAVSLEALLPTPPPTTGAAPTTSAWAPSATRSAVVGDTSSSDPAGSAVPAAAGAVPAAADSGRWLDDAVIAVLVLLAVAAVAWWWWPLRRRPLEEER